MQIPVCMIQSAGSSKNKCIGTAQIRENPCNLWQKKIPVIKKRLSLILLKIKTTIMKSRTGLFVILGIIVILLFWGCSAYNNLIGVDQQVKTKWSNVETNYQRRTDLYNSVIKTIEGSANFEKGTLTEVVQARAKATSITVDANDPKS